MDKQTNKNEVKNFRKLNIKNKTHKNSKREVERKTDRVLRKRSVTKEKNNKRDKINFFEKFLHVTNK